MPPAKPEERPGDSGDQIDELLRRLRQEGGDKGTPRWLVLAGWFATVLALGSFYFGFSNLGNIQDHLPSWLAGEQVDARRTWDREASQACASDKLKSSPYLNDSWPDVAAGDRQNHAWIDQLVGATPTIAPLNVSDSDSAQVGIVRLSLDAAEVALGAGEAAAAKADDGADYVAQGDYDRAVINYETAMNQLEAAPCAPLPAMAPLPPPGSSH